MDIDLIVILTVYLFTFYGETGAGVFAFFQGLLIDIFSGGILGFFSLLYLLLFLCIKLGSYPFHLLTLGGQILLIFLVVLSKNLLIFMFIKLFSLEAVFSFSIIFEFVISSLSTGLIAPFIFYIFNYMDSRFIRSLSERV